MRFWIGNALLATVVSLPCASAAKLSPCAIADVTRPARCGVFELAENPARPDGRRIPISVVVIPAAGGEALADPIVPLMGGPGEDAISAAAIFVEQLEPLLHDRDLVLIDQRGTGRSGALRCDLHASEDSAASLRDLLPFEAVERCAQRLSARADLTQYTYTHFANDLEYVRRALGYGPLNLFAGSYGTRAAQVYLRAYPQSVRTAYLGSVVPIDVATPLTMAREAQVALENTFSACAADPACRAAFPNVREEFRQVVVRLDSGAVRVSVAGQPGTVQVHRGRVIEWLRSKLYRPSDAASLPWMIHQAYAGDWNPIVEGVLSQARGMSSALSFGLFFSITCSEDIPFVREPDIARETQGTFLGDYRVRQQQAACRVWPKVSVPNGYRTPVRSSVPTLFVSGDTDGASPLWFTERVAPGFSKRLEVIHRGRGHTEWSDCVGRLYERFVRSGEVRGLDPSCKPLPRPPFKR
jgi:pimeloyl-ACP methyl ester carboxylesterase